MFYLIFQDVITDLNAESECLPLDPPKDDWLGHKVMFVFLLGLEEVKLSTIRPLCLKIDDSIFKPDERRKKKKFRHLPKSIIVLIILTKFVRMNNFFLIYHKIPGFIRKAILNDLRFILEWISKLSWHKHVFFAKLNRLYINSKNLQ